MRVVLDPNVLIWALLSRHGAPAQIVARWLAGDFELVVSDLLLTELERALAYPKLRARITEHDAVEYVVLLRSAAVVAPDRAETSRRSVDPGDDYLVALAEAERALLISGDQHLLMLGGDLPIRTPREFLGDLDKGLSD